MKNYRSIIFIILHILLNINNYAILLKCLKYGGNVQKFIIIQYNFIFNIIITQCQRQYFTKNINNFFLKLKPSRIPMEN